MPSKAHATRLRLSPDTDEADNPWRSVSDWRWRLRPLLRSRPAWPAGSPARQTPSAPTAFFSLVGGLCQRQALWAVCRLAALFRKQSGSRSPPRLVPFLTTWPQAGIDAFHDSRKSGNNVRRAVFVQAYLPGRQQSAVLMFGFPAASRLMDAALIWSIGQFILPSSWLITNMKGSVAVCAMISMSNAWGSATISADQTVPFQLMKRQFLLFICRRVTVTVTVTAFRAAGLSFVGQPDSQSRARHRLQIAAPQTEVAFLLNTRYPPWALGFALHGVHHRHALSSSWPFSPPLPWCSPSPKQSLASVWPPCPCIIVLGGPALETAPPCKMKVPAPTLLRGLLQWRSG